MDADGGTGRWIAEKLWPPIAKRIAPYVFSLAFLVVLVICALLAAVRSTLQQFL